MINEDQIREYIRQELEKIIDEMTTTGDVAGYLTPAAFRGNKKKNIARLRKIAKLAGFALTHRGNKELEEPADDSPSEMVRYTLAPLTENKYYEYRNDPTRTPHQKLASAISEINKQIAQVQHAIKLNARLKNEYGIDSSKMWKRTMKGLVKLEARLIGLAQQIREIRN